MLATVVLSLIAVLGVAGSFLLAWILRADRGRFGAADYRRNRP